MTENTFDDFIRVFEKAGLEIMPEDQFKAWLEKHEAYHVSSEGRADEILEAVRLDYYLEHIANYKFTEEMGEISGFGGGYEKAYRVMLDSGLQWLDENPDAHPRFSCFEGIYGHIDEDNEDAEVLGQAVLKQIDDATGAMYQAVVGSCLWTKEHGWEEYVKVMAKHEDES